MESRAIEGRTARSRASGMPASAVCVYADPEFADSLLFTLLKDRALEVSTDWGAFRSDGLLTAESAICVLVSLQTWVWTDLLKVRSHRLAPALMVITEYTRANAHALARAQIAGIDEVLFLDEVTVRSLTGAIAGLARRSITRLAAVALRENHTLLDAELAETLARACISPRLVRSVDELARLMGYSRSTLGRRWKQCTPARSHPHLFLEWLLLIHGLQIRSRSRESWKQIAAVLGVQSETLTDTCQRLFGLTLDDLEYLDREVILAKLWEILGFLSSVPR